MAPAWRDGLRLTWSGDSARGGVVAAGGQGAPRFAPAYHGALMARQRKPVVIVGIGGVANVTSGSARRANCVAFDTGPGKMPLIDDWMQRRQG